MNEYLSKVRWACRFSLAIVAVALVWPVPASGEAGPVDAPVSKEPRVPVAKCLSEPGLLASPGTYQPFVRVTKGEPIYSRDLLVAIPGFRIQVVPNAGGVRLTLWGNLPGLSESPVLESSVVLHDSRAYDLDLTLVRGRIVLTNIKKEGAAKIWVRAENGVQMVLPEPGDSVAIESYGRWPTRVPFSTKRVPGNQPIRLWEVECLKGKLEIKAGKTEWYMAEPPGPSYFHGDSIDGPAPGGPEKRARLPVWFDPKAERPKLAELMAVVVDSYKNRLTAKDPEEVAAEMLAAADKEKNPIRARIIRYLVVHAMSAVDEVGKVANLLNTSKHDEVRKAAVVGLRHWIGANEGRDEKLFEMLQHDVGFTRAEAETVMQLLHSPFDPEQPETYETLIAYLKHRKQAVRELAHWHLVRLAPIGRDIPYNAAAPAAERDKAAEQWKKRIPPGEMPKEKADSTKKKSEG